VNISGGTIGTDFNASVGSNVEIIGSDFRLNGEFVFLLDRVTVGPSDVFTGVLADGSSFIFGGFASDELNDVRLDFSTVPAADLNPIVINTPVVDGPSGLRRGQTLTLEAGGSLDFVDNYAVVEATLNVEGGVLGDSVETHNSLVNVSGGVVGDLFDAGPGTEVNLSGGTVGSGFDAFEGSEVNITGGTFGVDFDAGPGSTVNISGGIMGFNFDAFPNSQVNIFGRGILIEGEPLEGLVLGQPFTITDRNVTLSGLLADGEPFTLELNSSNETFDVDDFGLGIIFDGDDYFDPDATLTVTLVSPDPNVVLGDCDLNGVANFSDIAPFIAILASNTFLLEADCNLDGVVNFMDIASFIEILSGQ